MMGVTVSNEKLSCNVNDHVCSKRKGNVSRCVSPSVHRGSRGYPDQVILPLPIPSPFRFVLVQGRSYPDQVTLHPLPPCPLGPWLGLGLVGHGKGRELWSLCLVMLMGGCLVFLSRFLDASACSAPLQENNGGTGAQGPRHQGPQTSRFCGTGSFVQQEGRYTVSLLRSSLHLV